MPVPTPRKDEEQDKFMARCMHELSTPEATDRPQEQKVAICMRAWREKHPSAPGPKKDEESPRQEFVKVLERVGAELMKMED